MREILFRGKRKDNGEWIVGAYLPEAKNSNACIMRGEDGHIMPRTKAIIPETVGQYTGLTDKNGKKIFEGDICLVPLSMVYQRAVVEYNLKTANYDLRGKTFVASFHEYFGEEMKVIGNIHDNPEFLKESEDKENG